MNAKQERLFKSKKLELEEKYNVERMDQWTHSLLAEFGDYCLTLGMSQEEVYEALQREVEAERIGEQIGRAFMRHWKRQAMMQKMMEKIH